jgi:CheY-like chemotaxis protein
VLNLAGAEPARYPSRRPEMSATQTVLLVEDNDDDVKLIQRAFKKTHLPQRVEVARDGGEALNYLTGAPPYDDRDHFPLPALVILDLKMPRVDGFDVLAAVKGTFGLRRIPVIVLTSSSELSDIHRSYDLGANSYLVKPVAFGRFAEVVSEIESYWLGFNTPAAPPPFLE